VDGKPIDPRAYFSMLKGKLQTRDDLVKAKVDPMDAADVNDPEKLRARRKAFNFQKGVSEVDLHLAEDGTSIEGWEAAVNDCDAEHAIINNKDGGATMSDLMGSIDANTLKYHQDALAVEGERVLAFAQLVAPKQQLIDEKILVGTTTFELTHEDEETEAALGFLKDHEGARYGWTYLGMISLVDPPRDAVPGAVASCREASIQVVMVTGDHPLTAKSIATRIDIIQGDTWREFERENRIDRGEDPDLISEKEMFESYSHHEWFGLVPRFKKVKGLAIYGPTIVNFSDDDWRYSLRMKELVFARTQPEQKKEIVGRMKDLHNLNLEALDQLHAVKHMLDKDMNLSDVHDQLIDKYTEIDIQTRANEEAYREQCKEKKARTSGKDYEEAIEKIQAEGKQKKREYCRDKKFIEDKDGHTFMLMTYLMLPVRAKEIHNKLQGTSEAECARAAARGEKIDIVEPQDKGELLKFIDALIAKEEKRNNQPKVVAVTGDGVNDSPALKAADCGIAMGIAGADVAKENADMILLDDNFASIVQGIEQGRLIFDNLKKSIAYTLTSNIPEITPFLALIIIQIPIPLETVMILCIDLGTDMLPAISLAYEEAEGGIMRRAPRDKSVDRLVNSKLIGMAYGQIGMIQAAAGFACYFLVFDDFGLGYSDIAGEGFDYVDSDFKNGAGVNLVAGLGYDARMEILRKAQTSFLVSIVVAQWADVIICKTRERTIFEQKMTNNVLNVGLLEETILAIALVYCPPFHDAFKTTDIDFKMWCYGMPFSFLIWVYDELRKWRIRSERAGNDDWPENKGIVERWTYY
jgi:hydroxymethylpyrimidine pyrophosphatase-like HAD family hydrolase